MAKTIPGNPGLATQPQANPPTFNPLQPTQPFGKRTSPTGSSLSGLDSAMGDAADKLHPLGDA